MEIQFVLATPFSRDGSVDLAALTDEVTFLEHAGVTSIVVNGSSSEFPSLTVNERMMVLETVRRCFTGDIVVNISSTCLPDSIQLQSHGEELADSLMIAPPYYFSNASEDGLVNFFARIADTGSKPIYLYSNPSSARYPITVSLARKILSRTERVVGVKESSGGLENSKALKAAFPNLHILAGREADPRDVSASGLDGIVTASGLPIPELMYSSIKESKCATPGEASPSYTKYQIWSALRKELDLQVPAFMKAGLATRIPGFPLFCRPPLSEATAEAAHRIGSFLRSCQAF